MAAAKKPSAWKNRIVNSGQQPADQFLAHELNARRHPAKQREALRGSLNELGWIAPVVVSKRTGKILDGHARVEEALSKDENSLVPFVELDVTENEERLILASFDPITALAEYDKEALDSLLKDVNTGDAALQAMLSELAESQGLYLDGDGNGSNAQETEESAAEIVDRAEELQEKWQVKRSDIWSIGRHRLMCGNSLEESDVKRLVADGKIKMVFADPPYGISIVAANVSVGGGEAYDIPFGGVKKGSVGGAKPFGSQKARGSVGASNMVDVGKYAPVIGDDTTETAVKSYSIASSLFLDAVHIWWGGNYYADTLPPSSCWIVWDKENTGNFADAELAWTNQKTAVRIFKHMWNGLMKASEKGVRRVHPTQKPVALAEWCFDKYGKEGDEIFDPFLGSGMSLIAAENTGRTLYGIEMSEEYCAVILERAKVAFPSLRIARVGDVSKQAYQ